MRVESLYIANDCGVKELSVRCVMIDFTMVRLHSSLEVHQNLPHPQKLQ